MVKSKGIEVDRRVRIAMSSLPPAQRAAVEQVMSSPESFTHAISAPGQSQIMRTSGQPLYKMRVASNLRLIYTIVGDTYHVLDVVEKATLNHFAAPKAAKAARPTKSAAPAEARVITSKAPAATKSVAVAKTAAKTKAHISSVTAAKLAKLPGHTHAKKSGSGDVKKK
jgi:hypothetical protein